MTERDDFIAYLAETIGDYRTGEIPEPLPEVIDLWLRHFGMDAPYQIQTGNLANRQQYEWGHQIHVGDCLELMRAMPPDSVDLIVTSPPYADARKHTYGGISPDDYVAWFTQRAEQMLRVLKPSGSFVLNIKEKAVDGQRHTYVLDLILALNRDVGFRWVEEYIWHKTTAAPGKWKYRFRDAWERILHFSKTPELKMRQDAVKVPVGDWTQNRLRNMSRNDRTRRQSATNPKIGRKIAAWEGKDTVYPSNVLHRSPVAHNTGHSAAFPEWLPEFFIRLFTDAGDVVLDPFSGSGTTFRVASRLGRIPIGIEINPDYVAPGVDNA